jgi:hypothetical protein
LRTFADDIKKEQQVKDELTRSKLAKQRSLMLENGELTADVVRILKSIFSLYSDDPMYKDDDDALTIPVTRAARLWYRCGIKLSTLEQTMEGREGTSVLLDDFLSVIKAVVDEDDAMWQTVMSPDSESRPAFEVSDVLAYIFI